MSFWQRLLAVLDTEMPAPEPYGWFHLLFVLLSVIAVIPLYRHCRQPGQIRRVVLLTALVVLALELYKQVNYAFSYENGISFDFQWYAFPFQFCSTPMYVGLLAGLTRKGKLHESLCAYLATYSIFAGVSVMAYPVTVFVKTVGINLQTMICHGSMITIGIYLLATGYVPLKSKTVVKALPVFLVNVALAAIMNEIAYVAGLLETDGFNMFFISPHQDPHLPVYSLVQQAVPYPWCLVIYVLGFTAAGWLMLVLGMAVAKFKPRKKIPA